MNGSTSLEEKMEAFALGGFFHKPQSIVLILACEKFVISFHVLLNYIVNA